MLDLANCTPADFRPRLDEEFELMTGTGGITLHLVKVVPGSAGHSARTEPFSLYFQGAPGLLLAQGIYEVQNLTLGAMQIFLVQIGNDAKGSSFQAVFN